MKTLLLKISNNQEDIVFFTIIYIYINLTLNIYLLLMIVLKL
jgi:hypothetical protein